nr:hypothetical protein Iba_chr10fCG8110 [Ipomoea batatas]
MKRRASHSGAKRQRHQGNLRCPVFTASRPSTCSSGHQQVDPAVDGVRHCGTGMDGNVWFLHGVKTSGLLLEKGGTGEQMPVTMPAYLNGWPLRTPRYRLRREDLALSKGF